MNVKSVRCLTIIVILTGLIGSELSFAKLGVPIHEIRKSLYCNDYCSVPSEIEYERLKLGWLDKVDERDHVLKNFLKLIYDQKNTTLQALNKIEMTYSGASLVGEVTTALSEWTQLFFDIIMGEATSLKSELQAGLESETLKLYKQRIDKAMLRKPTDAFLYWRNEKAIRDKILNRLNLFESFEKRASLISKDRWFLTIERASTKENFNAFLIEKGLDKYVDIKSVEYNRRQRDTGWRNSVVLPLRFQITERNDSCKIDYQLRILLAIKFDWRQATVKMFEKTEKQTLETIFDNIPLNVKCINSVNAEDIHSIFYESKSLLDFRYYGINSCFPFGCRNGPPYLHTWGEDIELKH